MDIKNIIIFIAVFLLIMWLQHNDDLKLGKQRKELYNKIKILYKVEIDISNIKNSSYWNNKIFEVFITDLHNTLIESGYTIDQSNKIVKQHLIKSKILSFKYLYIMRFKTAYLNLEILLKYKNYINNKYLFYCFILLLFPVSKKDYI
jgi:hypothetical protein